MPVLPSPVARRPVSGAPRTTPARLPTCEVLSVLPTLHRAHPTGAPSRGAESTGPASFPATFGQSCHWSYRRAVVRPVLPVGFPTDTATGEPGLFRCPAITGAERVVHRPLVAADRTALVIGLGSIVHFGCCYWQRLGRHRREAHRTISTVMSMGRHGLVDRERDRGSVLTLRHPVGVRGHRDPIVGQSPPVATWARNIRSTGALHTSAVVLASPRRGCACPDKLETERRYGVRLAQILR